MRRTSPSALLWIWIVIVLAVYGYQFRDMMPAIFSVLGLDF
jgi:hypothetical protein